MTVQELRRINDDRRLWLRRRLRELDWSQSELARRSGVDKATISRLVTLEKHQPAFETMVLVMEALERG